MSDKVIICEMIAEDIPKVADIEKECFSMPWSKEALLESFKQDYSYFVVAKVDDNVAGYGGIYIVGDEAEIINIAVSGKYRGAGIGKKIVMSLLDKSNEKNAASTILEVRSSNATAIALYEKCGFEKIGIRKNFYEKPVEDAVIMWKEKQ